MGQVGQVGAHGGMAVQGARWVLTGAARMGQVGQVVAHGGMAVQGARWHDG